jgi:hypothetical protein
MREIRLPRIGARLALALAPLLLLAAAPSSLIAKPRFSSTVGAKERFDSGTFELVFFGHVHSPKASCRRGRTVQLRVVDRSGNQPPVNLGTDRTDRSGRWEIRLPSDGLAGDYVARALRRSTPKLVCRSARSDPVDFGTGA